MQYLVIRCVFYVNAFYVVLLLLRQILQVDTISIILVVSQVALLMLIASGLSTIRFKREELLLIFLVCVSLLKSDFDVYRLNNILVDFIKPLLFILTIASIRSKVTVTYFIYSNINRIFDLYVIATVASVCVGLYYYSFVSAIYPAYSSVYSLIGLFYLMRRSRFISLWYLVVLALSGKRAVMFSGLLAELIVRRVFKFNFSRFLIFLAIFFVSFFVLINIGWEWVAFNILKINLNVLDAAVDNIEVLSYIAGGRLDELVDGLSYDFSAANVLFGKSLGYTYESLSFDELEHKNFHFTPASLFSQYGLLFTVLFLRYVFQIIFEKHAKVCADRHVNIYIIRMYLVGSLFFFVTEYGVFGYINFCIGLGLLAGCKYLRNEPRVKSA
jgi:hypothetical protein